MIGDPNYEPDYKDYYSPGWGPFYYEEDYYLPPRVTNYGKRVTGALSGILKAVEPAAHVIAGTAGIYSILNSAKQAAATKEAAAKAAEARRIENELLEKSRKTMLDRKAQYYQIKGEQLLQDMEVANQNRVIAPYHPVLEHLQAETSQRPRLLTNPRTVRTRNNDTGAFVDIPVYDFDIPDEPIVMRRQDKAYTQLDRAAKAAVKDIKKRGFAAAMESIDNPKLRKLFDPAILKKSLLRGRIIPTSLYKFMTPELRDKIVFDFAPNIEHMPKAQQRVVKTLVDSGVDVDKAMADVYRLDKHREIRERLEDIVGEQARNLPITPAAETSQDIPAVSVGDFDYPEMHRVLTTNVERPTGYVNVPIFNFDVPGRQIIQNKVFPIKTLDADSNRISGIIDTHGLDYFIEHSGNENQDLVNMLSRTGMEDAFYTGEYIPTGFRKYLAANIRDAIKKPIKTPPKNKWAMYGIKDQIEEKIRSGRPLARAAQSVYSRLLTRQRGGGFSKLLIPRKNISTCIHT